MSRQTITCFPTTWVVSVPRTPLRTKATEWLDPDRKRTLYGVAVMNIEGKWCHVAKQTSPGLYQIEKYFSREERDRRRAELRKVKSLSAWLWRESEVEND